VPTRHRAFGELDHAAFERVLGQWFAAQGLEAEGGLEAEEGIAIEGKTLRGLHGAAVPGVHLVAAYAHRTRVVRAQAQTRGKGQEWAGVGGSGREWSRGWQSCPPACSVAGW
jgi:hypothetical protein